MLSLHDAFYQLKKQLETLYDDREAAAIAHELLQHITGLDKMRRLLQKEQLLTAGQMAAYQQGTQGLKQGKPIQYVTGLAWFAGKEYVVNEHVLIPRPETEELVEWILSDNPKNNQNPSILDIGTGSGCIPISLKCALPEARISSCDISPEALATAATNAQRIRAEIRLHHLNFLDAAQWTQLGQYEMIVSNPPYIPIGDRELLHDNVKNHEPSLALFVPTDDPLVFYRAIGEFAQLHLLPGGHIYCELEASHATHCEGLFSSMGYRSVTVRKDMHGNDRMIRVAWND